MKPSRLRALTNCWPLDRGIQRAMRLVRAIQHRRVEPDEYIVIEEKLAGLRFAVNLHHKVHWTMYYFSRPLLRATRRCGAFMFIVRSLQPEEAFIDVGANFGLFSLQIARHDRKRRIVAIEPHPAIAESLRRTAEVNGFANIRVLQTALADERGEAELFIDQQNFGGHALHRRRNKSAAPIRVPVQTFDKAIVETGIDDAASIGMVKIDVEGAEAKVIAGMKEILEQGHRPRIICEVRGPRARGNRGEKPFHETTAGRVIATLDPYGYRPHAIERDGSPRPVKREEIRGLMDLALLPG